MKCGNILVVLAILLPVVSGCGIAAAGFHEEFYARPTPDELPDGLAFLSFDYYQRQEQCCGVVGSGVVVKKYDQLWVVTASHIDVGHQGPEFRLHRAMAITADEAVLPVELVALDRQFHLAVFRFKKPENYKGSLARLAAGAPPIGEPVSAVGAPGGRRWRKSSGLIRNADTTRTILGERVRVMEHSSRIDPGMSGGPLLNRRGETVGINVFLIVDWLGGYWSYAVPSQEIEKFLDDIAAPTPR
jgi:S1-C subfamily serine protease